MCFAQSSHSRTQVETYRIRIRLKFTSNLTKIYNKNLPEVGNEHLSIYFVPRIIFIPNPRALFAACLSTHNNTHFILAANILRINALLSCENVWFIR